MQRFADDKSYFSNIKDIDTSNIDINKELLKMENFV